MLMIHTSLNIVNSGCRQGSQLIVDTKGQQQEESDVWLTIHIRIW